MYLYNLATRTYFLLIRVFSLFNKKANLWVLGRKNWQEKLIQSVGNNSGYIWVHCASLGEFEQGRPLIEKIKTNHPNEKILLTFFSPSGFEIRKNYPVADLVIYLPADSSKNAKIFLEITKPKMAVFIKYEFWFHYLKALHQANILIFYVSAIFRKNQYFFKWYGKQAVAILKQIDYFFLQDKTSKELLESIGIKNCSVSGDTRFDRVLQLKQDFKELPLVKKFTENNFTIVAGSTWPKDEVLIAKFIAENSELNINWIIAPHNISNNECAQLKAKLNGNASLFSESTIENISAHKVLIIDNIGMLSSLYFYGSMAYIGGGFGRGIHNILEATTFGKFVFFGPHYKNFKEAKELCELGVTNSIANDEDFKSVVLEMYNQPQLLIEKGNESEKYTIANAGATQFIYDHVNHYFKD